MPTYKHARVRGFAPWSPKARSARRGRVAEMARRREHRHCIVCDAEGPKDDQALRDLGWWFVEVDMDEGGEGGAQVCADPACKAEAIAQGMRSARRLDGDP